MIRLMEMTRPELGALLESWGERPFRTRQLWSWLYVKLAADFEEMTDLSKLFRARLQESCQLERLREQSHLQSADGTEKWLLTLADGEVIETVFIPEEGRGTLCISSQAGCSLACAFCRTGAQGLARNLTAAEIVGQVIFARVTLAQRGLRVTNVVVMGMGEPLYNYEAVASAMRIIMDTAGLAIGTRKLTLSTAGVVPLIPRIGAELGINLAISLHAVTDELRNRLVPLNRKFGVAALHKAAQVYPGGTGRRIFWEYVLLDGINDRETDARDLIAFVRGISSKINLIPFNPWPGSLFTPSRPEAVRRFQEILQQAGLVTVVRDSRGADIGAACGQLKGALLAAPKARRAALSAATHGLELDAGAASAPGLDAGAAGSGSAPAPECDVDVDSDF